MALNTNKREGDKLHAEEWNELVQEVQGKQPRLNIVDALDSTSSVDVLSAKQGKILNNKIEDTKAIAQDVEAIVKTLPVGYFYGTFTTEEELPSEISEKGYAYVGTAPDYVIYTYEPTIGWRATENKYSTPTLETNLGTKSQTKAPTTKAVKEGIEAIDVTSARSSEDGNELTKVQKFNASANINDRTADVVVATGEVKALGYKVLNLQQSFTSQVVNANTVYEIRDEFDLNNESVTIPANCTLKFNGGKLSNGTINFNGCYIDSPNVQIFGTDMEFANVNVKNTELVATWFGFTPENTDVTQLNKVIAFGCNVFVPKGEYLLTSSIVKTTSNLGRIRGEMRNTLLKSTTCDIFNVRKLEISNFKIRAEGYYGIKDNNGYLKVIDNDIQVCAVGVGSELGTPINKMETEITQNTIQYCTDCGIKYHGSVNGSAATDGYISGLVIHDNYIVKAGTNVDDYTTPGTEGTGYGMFIKDVYSAVITENVAEYCSCGGILFQIKDYVCSNISIKYNRFEQNKRFQICVDVTTGSSVRGIEITNNSSSYPFAKVSNFIKEWYLTGKGVLSGIVNSLYKNNIFGFSRSNPLGINDLYTYCQSLYSVGITAYVENAVIKDIQDNASIDLYKLYRIQSYPICAVEKGKTYVIQFDIEKKVSVSGYYFLKITGANENINVSYTQIQQNTVFHCKCFVVPTATGILSFSGSYFTGSVDNIDSDTVMFKITNLTVLESNSVIANSLTEIRGISSSAAGCRVFINGASNSMNIYNGTSWVEQDGEAAGIRRTGTSTQRPTPTNIGFKYFDTTLGKPIFWNGSAWIDGDGNYIFDNSGTLQNRLALTSPIKGQQFKLTGGENDVYLIYGDYGWLNATNRTPRFDDSGTLNSMYDKYNYTLFTEEPSDWSTKYNTYYKVVNGVYTLLTTLETWTADTYYKKDVNAYKGIQVKLTDTDTELLNKVVKWNGTKYINIVDNAALKAGTPIVTFTTENNITTATITSTSSGKIYYTKNGDAPTSASSEYSNPIDLATGDQVKAICIRDHIDNSAIGFVKAATPVVSFDSAGILAITCDTADAKIYYTTDGSVPSTASTEYDSSASVTIAKGVTVNAIAVLIGRVNSEKGFKKRS